MDITPLHDHRCLLGESPLWVPDEQALYCVDIPSKETLRFGPNGSLQRWAQDSEPSSLALSEGGGLLVSRRDGLFSFDPTNGATKPLASPPYNPAYQRFNDGKAGPDGAWWVGTLDDAREPHAGLFRCNAAGLAQVADGISVSNGLAWSPDARWMYWSDTKAHAIYRFPFNNGQLGQRELWARFPSRDPEQPLDRYAGRPDGAAVDVQGCYWVAMFEGQRLLRLAPSGEILKSLHLPVRCPTMLCFGGADLQTLFITTAREKRPAEELAAQPFAGAVLTHRVEVAGLPALEVAW
jgi:sugar lactone lactonase YvrE